MAPKGLVISLIIGIILMLCLTNRIPMVSLISSFNKSPQASSFRQVANLSPRRLNATPGSVLSELNLEEARKAAHKVLSLIHNRYEMDQMMGRSFFLAANNMGEHTWDILKYKFAKKMMEGNQTFLMIFAGSSVTAGHDSYMNQSFPAIAEARLKPILQALGVNLEVHNIAQAANNCIPYSFCYEAMGGLNPDFIAWEQVS